jgi:4-hydroxybenzoate polyprenyltransferase
MVYSTKPRWYLENFLKKTIKGLIELTRTNETTYIVAISSLLGVAAAQQSFNWRILIVLIANWLAAGLTYIIHNIKNAPEDVFANRKFNQNPIAKGDLSRTTARITGAAVGITALGLYALLGLWPLIFGSLILVLGFLFSMWGIHLKTGTPFDIWAHTVIFTALQFFVGFFSIKPHFGRNWYWSLIFIITVQAVIAINRNIKQYESEKIRDQRGSGHRLKTAMRFTWMVVAAFTGVMTFIIDEIIPIWVIVLGVGLSGLLLILSLIKKQRENKTVSTQSLIQKHLEIAGVLALVLHFILPLF